MKGANKMNKKNQQPRYEIFPIGYAHQEQGNYYIEILPPYRPGLKELEQFSHVKIYWWGDQCDTHAMRSMLETDLPYAKGIQAGVFACRAEFRPNPILETISFILDIDQQQGVITLPWIDAFDGTPILDLKPYIPISDRVRDVQVAEWFQGMPEWMEDAAEYFAAFDEGAFE
jgi:tRNA-Thr(GGU) m(6)t(6)A37 methyltransferase TsaA